MARTVYAGETVRITAEDLTHADSGAVTSGATVTIDLYEPDGTLVSTNTAAAAGDDWFFDLDMPATPGQYRILIEATYNGAVARDRLLLTVKPFAA
jgi:hypothetical protein